MTKAVFAGSFDPFTEGHLDLVRRSAKLFQEVVILIAENPQKKYLFDLKDRKKWIEQVVTDISNVSVSVHSGLTVDFMHSVGANYLIRGVRNAQDFDFEWCVASNNKKLYSQAETILLPCSPEYLSISSSVVRELIRFSASLKGFVPESIRDSVEKKGKELLCLE